MLCISILATGFPSGSVVKNLPAYAGDAGDMGLIHWLGRYPGEGNGNLLQYSCLGNLMDRRAWWATSPWGHEGPDTRVTEKTGNYTEINIVKIVLKRKHSYSLPF